MPPSTIKDTHTEVIRGLVTLNARLLDASASDENGRFVQTLLDIERLVRYSRERLQAHIVIDVEEVDDEEL